VAKHPLDYLDRSCISGLTMDSLQARQSGLVAVNPADVLPATTTSASPSSSSSTSTSPTSSDFGFRVPVVPAHGNRLPRSASKLARTAKAGQLSLDLSNAHLPQTNVAHPVPSSPMSLSQPCYGQPPGEVLTPISPVSPMHHDQSAAGQQPQLQQPQPHSVPSSPAYPPQTSPTDDPSAAGRHRLKRSYSASGGPMDTSSSAASTTQSGSHHYPFFAAPPDAEKQPGCKWSAEALVKTHSIQGVGAFVFKVYK
jgi:hypothetical protein